MQVDTETMDSLLNSTPIDRAHALEVSVGEAWNNLLKTTEAEVHMATYVFLVCLYTSLMAGCPQAVQISITTVVEVASGI